MQGFVKKEDVKFPPLLLEIDYPPLGLYFKGCWLQNLFKNCVSIVGSRKMNSYGFMALSKFIRGLSGTNITIVSGFMYGVDSQAHELALDSGLRTIAVLPGGIDYIYPSAQKPLYERIISENGLVVSETGGCAMPKKWSFPKRNRIVAGLSWATVVVQAEHNSGSLITANLAKKYKRTVFSVPGEITSTLSQGTNDLIKHGAKPLTNADDLLAHLEIKGVGSDFSPLEVVFDSKQKQVVDYLASTKASIDTISSDLNMSIAETSQILTDLILKGIIYEHGGIYYAS